MDQRTEVGVGMLVVWLVLFTAMLEPRISFGLAIIGLVLLATYQLAHTHRHRRSL